MKDDVATGIGITGIGVHFPPDVRTNDWWLERDRNKSTPTDILESLNRAASAGDQRVDPEIARHFAPYKDDAFRGSKARRVLAENLNPSDMEAAAGKAALEDAKCKPADIDLLITFSQVPDFVCPGNHALVAEKIGLPEHTTSFTVGADCASFVPHVHVATAMLQSGQYRRALIIQSNASSRVVDWALPNSVAVGDAAAACVLENVGPGHGVLGYKQVTLGGYHPAVRIAPKDDPSIPWYRGDVHASQMIWTSMDQELTVEAAGQAVSLCRKTCLPLLDQAGLSASDIDWVICSQPTVWFGAACAEGLGVDPERSINTFAEYGHPMPASAPVNLWAGHTSKRFKNGDLIMVYSPGPGFVNAGLLLRWKHPDNEK